MVFSTDFDLKEKNKKSSALDQLADKSANRQTAKAVEMRFFMTSRKKHALRSRRSHTKFHKKNHWQNDIPIDFKPFETSIIQKLIRFFFKLINKIRTIMRKEIKQ